MYVIKSAILLCLACATVFQGQTPDAAPAVPTAGDSPADKAAAAPGNAFVIGPEDVIYIRILHEPDISGPQDVRPDGMIQLQLIGEVKAAGLTPAQLSAAIREKLLQTMRNPEVSVQLMRVNSRKYTIQGEIMRPGTYTFASPVKVLDAIVNGGGFRDFANPKKVYILRNGQKLPFNYKDVSHGKHMEQNIVIENGDEIFVP